MELQEAISLIHNQKPSMATDVEIIRWISNLDRTVKNELIDTHEQTEEITFDGYNSETPKDTILLVPEPYSDVYLYYCFQQIDFINAETDLFNNDMIMFSGLYGDYKKHYNSTHKPKTCYLNFY